MAAVRRGARGQNGRLSQPEKGTLKTMGYEPWSNNLRNDALDLRIFEIC